MKVGQEKSKILLNEFNSPREEFETQQSGIEPLHSNTPVSKNRMHKIGTNFGTTAAGSHTIAQ